MKETMDSFGARLAQLRQAAGLSQQGLADRLSVTRQAVSNWERGQTLPDLDTLRSIAQALGTDLNTLGGSAAPIPRRRAGRNVRTASALLCLCAAFAGGLCLSRVALAPAEPAAQAVQESAQPTSLAPHKIRYTTADGITVITAADGWEELKEALLALPGDGAEPVERTAALSDTLCYFADQYELRFAPDYRDGGFSSWDQVLFWLYKAGISDGGIMTTEEVDAALTSLFGTGLRYEHQSTEHFPLTEEGYYPVDVGTNTAQPYTLVSFDSPEPGVYEAVLREKGGPELTVTLALEEDLPRLTAITRAGQEGRFA